ncbi:unnamed protein product [Fusarium graminearum]|uniref:Uncharacterized protein n=1 Tax=Gibberella zeae TaxID=5518 RepID=A0A679P3M1_GIBZA|nr:unnamed protein product [Fusarium graminearum]CAG2001109.1 unnamed protein product [Fusarium graminearum]CZS80594.1 unnamed protein product [Fusarium graminearum]
MKLRLSRTDSSNVPGNHSSINSPNLLAKSRPRTTQHRLSKDERSAAFGLNYQASRHEILGYREAGIAAQRGYRPLYKQETRRLPQQRQ